MIAKELYEKLNSDFILPELSDEWNEYMEPVADYVCDNFRRRSMGLVCDFATKIAKVYCAVFPEREVMQKILDEGTEDALLFVHHPAIWDIREFPVFQPMDVDMLEQFKQRRVAIYNLHTPLDNFGEYSTSNALAKALGVKVTKPCVPYYGALAGVIGTTELPTIEELQKKFEEILGHESKLYKNGDSEIENGIVMVVAGGGHDVFTLEEMKKENVKVLVTGITAKNNYSAPSHEFSKDHGFNVLGGTHYSTEAFACRAMCDYFEKLGLTSEFVPGRPVMEDM